MRKTLLALTFLCPALGVFAQSGSWQVDVKQTDPPRPIKVSQAEAVEAKLKTYRDIGWPQQRLDEIKPALEKAVLQETQGMTATGTGRLVLDGENGAFQYPTIVYNGKRDYLTIEAYVDGVGVKHVKPSGSVTLAGRDTRMRFRVLSERIVVQQEPGSAPIIRKWKDDQGREWIEYRDLRPGQRLNVAHVRWKNGKAVEGVTPFTSKPGSQLFSRTFWKNDRSFGTLILEKFVTGRLASRMELINWKKSEARISDLLKEVPLGIRVEDHRLSEDEPLRYKWTGEISSLAQLKDMERSGVAAPAQKPVAVGPLSVMAGLGALLMAYGAFALLRVRSSKP